MTHPGSGSPGPKDSRYDRQLEMSINSQTLLDLGAWIASVGWVLRALGSHWVCYASTWQDYFYAFKPKCYGESRWVGSQRECGEASERTFTHVPKCLFISLEGAVVQWKLTFNHGMKGNKSTCQANMYYFWAMAPQWNLDSSRIQNLETPWNSDNMDQVNKTNQKRWMSSPEMTDKRGHFKQQPHGSTRSPVCRGWFISHNRNMFKKRKKKSGLPCHFNFISKFSLPEQAVYTLISRVVFWGYTPQHDIIFLRIKP